MNCIIKKCCNKICFWKKSQKIVAHVVLNGVIGKDSKFDKSLNIDSVFPLLKTAFETKDLVAVAISINSPGGSPVQSELIYNAIRELSDAKKIPVFTFARDVAASGGYWLLLSGDEIYAHNSSIIGSIGVIFSSFGFVDLINKIGVERRIYTEGKNKAILDPFLKEDSQNIEILKAAQKDIFDGFKELVTTRRAGKLKNENGENASEDFLNDKIFTGAFWSGKTAKKFGLVDDVSDMRNKMKEKFGDKVEFRNIAVKKSLLKSLFGAQHSEKLASSLIDKIEERVSFNHYGL